MSIFPGPRMQELGDRTFPQAGPKTLEECAGRIPPAAKAKEVHEF